MDFKWTHRIIKYFICNYKTFLLYLHISLFIYYIMKLFIKNKEYFDTIPGSREIHKEAFRELQSESSSIIGVPYELLPVIGKETHCFVLHRYDAEKDLYIYQYNGGTN